jgi:hypothetical protein
MKWLWFGASMALLTSLGITQEPQELPGVEDGPVAKEALKPGFIGHYWNVGKEMTKFPMEVLAETPGLTRIDGVISFNAKEERGFGSLPWKEFFAVEWTGLVRLPKDAEFTFYLKSHGGSRLYIDDKLIVDHDGMHPLKETASKSVTMMGGDHDVRIEYFQNRMALCEFSWKYDKVDKEIVPSTALWHKYDKSVDRESN